MARNIRKLVKDIIFYGFANGIEALTPLLLAPILTRYLSVHDYGTWAIYLSLLSFLTPVVGLTLHDSLRMRYFDLCNTKLARYVSSSLLVTGLVTVFVTLIVYMLPNEILAYTKFPQLWMWSIFLAAFMYSIYYFTRAIMQFGNDRKKFIILQSTQTVITLVLSIILVMNDYGWQGCIIAKIIGLSVTAFLGTILIGGRKVVRIRHVSKDYMSELIIFGIKYLPSGLVAVIVVLTDRLFIANMLGVEFTAIYTIGGMFSFGLVIAINAFMFAWLPWLFRKLSGNEEHELRDILLASILYFICLPIAAFVLYMVSIFVAPYLLGDNFHKAIEYIPWLVFAVVFQGYLQHNTGYMLFKKRTALISLCTLIVIALNFVFNYILIPEYQLLGAAWATIFSYLVSIVISFVIIAVLYRNGASNGNESKESTDLTE